MGTFTSPRLFEARQMKNCVKKDVGVVCSLSIAKLTGPKRIYMGVKCV
jgi:hypothetical protein